MMLSVFMYSKDLVSNIAEVHVILFKPIKECRDNVWCYILVLSQFSDLSQLTAWLFFACCPRTVLFPLLPLCARKRVTLGHSRELHLNSFLSQTTEIERQRKKRKERGGASEMKCVLKMAGLPLHSYILMFTEEMKPWSSCRDQTGGVGNQRWPRSSTSSDFFLLVQPHSTWNSQSGLIQVNSCSSRHSKTWFLETAIKIL